MRCSGLWASILLVSVPLISCSSEDEAGNGCDGVACSGHGHCVEVGGQATCECDTGFVAQGLECVDSTIGVPTTDTIEQWGVTWTFDAEYPYGTYANGDYWVLGPVVLTDITPSYADGHHGWEVNPAEVVEQGFDERIADFVASRVPSLPYTAQAGESIVKGVSLEPLSDDECRPCLQTAAVLTVVAEVPPDRGETVFRPPYFGSDKPNYSTLVMDAVDLPTYAPTENAPTLEDTVTRFERVMLDHKTNWTGRALHPADNMPDYGSDIATRDADGALALMLDYSRAEKQQLLVHYVQAGIDLYHMALGGETWPPGGGHGEGRKLPVTFAAHMLGDAAMQQFVSSSEREVFGENGGMYYSDNAQTVLFGQTPNSEESYWTNLVFDTGSRTIIDPYQWIDGGHVPGGSYQFCCTAMAWKATATAIYLMPELRSVWNHEEFFEYVDRWVSFGAHSQPDPCAPPDGTCSGGDNPGAPCTLASAPTVCTGTDAFCDATVNWDANYGVTYGPDGSGGCILDTDTTDGTGRFPPLHGASTNEGHYGSSFVEEMWDTYVNP